MSAANLFMEILDRSNASDVLFAHAPPATMYRIGRTCWMARRAVQDYSRRAFNINRHLRRFFHDPVGFRSLQAQTGTLIWGAFAYRFFARTLCDETHLDLLVSPQHALEVGRWVIESGGKGYHFKPTLGQHRHFDVAVRTSPEWPQGWDGGDDKEVYFTGYGVQNLLKFVTDEVEASLTVRIIVTRCALSQTLIMTIWRSMIFGNIITFRAAYSLNAIQTFRVKQSVTRLGAYLDFDEPRGRDVDLRSTVSLTASTSLPRTFEPRWVDDELSWVLRFDMHGVSWPMVSRKKPQLLFDPFSVNCWDNYLLRSDSHTLEETIPWKIDYEIFKFPYCWAAYDKDLRRIIDRLLKWERAKRMMFPNQKHWTWYDDVLFDYKMRLVKSSKSGIRWMLPPNVIELL
ncbi:hypothetical protein BD410DRAFT_790140 [Rickenella mellea]|uniref:Uncharacterized protein n=1 Tax=Rickenella mellea TaxID=50990 RepID=A0A4Y7Q2S8_9AGAM|nr:hypothetical protein BD410DRAFT_790140 [Rickenella mellea]